MAIVGCFASRSHRILESSSRPPSSRAFWLDTVKSTRVVARPTSLCHQLGPHTKRAQNPTRTPRASGGNRCAFEEILQIVIMAVTQTSHVMPLPVSLQFPSHTAVLAAVAGLECETAVSPQLSLGAEMLRRLQQRDLQRHTNLTDRRDLAKQCHGRILVASASGVEGTSERQ
jgi:hypothetical protein